jgi:hypothetical protein|tara:strand:- start:1024 stop:1194 length:171 start_codon:yes stop_codon:yes gene_type:complete
LKQERERKLTKIRNKWLETVKYTGMLDEDEFSEVASKPVDKSSTTSPARRRPGQDR